MSKRQDIIAALTTLLNGLSGMDYATPVYVLPHGELKPKQFNLVNPVCLVVDNVEEISNMPGKLRKYTISPEIHIFYSAVVNHEKYTDIVKAVEGIFTTASILGFGSATYPAGNSCEKDNETGCTEITFGLVITFYDRIA